MAPRLDPLANRAPILFITALIWCIPAGFISDGAGCAAQDSGAPSPASAQSSAETDLREQDRLATSIEAATLIAVAKVTGVERYRGKGGGIIGIYTLEIGRVLKGVDAPERARFTLQLTSHASEPEFSHPDPEKAGKELIVLLHQRRKVEGDPWYSLVSVSPPTWWVVDSPGARQIEVAVEKLLKPAAPDPSVSAPLHPTVPLPAPLARVLTDYEKAWRKKDAAALAALFAEDGFVLPRWAPPVRGRARIQEHYANSGGPLALRALAYAAEGSVGYIIVGFARREGEPDVGKATLTLRKDADGRWLIMSDMDSDNSRRE